MRSTTSSYIVELPLRVNDQQNRFLEKAFEFGRMLYNATLGTALGRLQRMRETKEWREARASTSSVFLLPTQRQLKNSNDCLK